MPRVVFRSAAFLALAVACAFGSACGDSYGDGTPPSTGTPDGASDAPDTGVDAADAGAGVDADAAEPRFPVPRSAVVVRKVLLGDTDRAGVASAQAWQQFGRNVDGVVSPDQGLRRHLHRHRLRGHARRHRQRRAPADGAARAVSVT